MLTVLLWSVAVVFIGLGLAFFAGWFARKVIAHTQHRVGPYLAGPHGIAQEVADFLKLMSKELITVRGSDELVLDAAPLFCTALLVWALLFIPVCGTRGVLSLPGDLLLLILISDIASLLVVLIGYAQPGPFASVGTGRAGEQLLSYEVPFCASMFAALILARTIDVSGIVKFQSGFRWIIALNPIAFVAFLIGLFAEFDVPPFAPPVIETEIAGGYEVELSGRRLAFLRLAHNLELAFFSILGALLFLGGPQPLIPGLEWLGVVWLALKALAIMFVVSFLTACFPTYRIDQVVSIFWRAALPLSIASIALSLALVCFGLV